MMIKQKDADEIEVLYRDAKDKQNQLSILKDLYPNYNKDEIETMLVERGYTVPGRRRKRSQDTAKTAGKAKSSKAAGGKAAPIPEAVLEAVRNSVLDISKTIDDYQNQLAELNSALMEQQAKLKELDGFLKLYQED